MNKIYNPQSSESHNISSKEGKAILKKYISLFLKGGTNYDKIVINGIVRLNYFTYTYKEFTINCLFLGETHINEKTCDKIEKTKCFQNEYCVEQYQFIDNILSQSAESEKCIDFFLEKEYLVNLKGGFKYCKDVVINSDINHTNKEWDSLDSNYIPIASVRDYFYLSFQKNKKLTYFNKHYKNTRFHYIDTRLSTNEEINIFKLASFDNTQLYSKLTNEGKNPIEGFINLFIFLIGEKTHIFNEETVTNIQRTCRVLVNETTIMEKYELGKQIFNELIELFIKFITKTTHFSFNYLELLYNDDEEYDQGKIVQIYEIIGNKIQKQLNNMLIDKEYMINYFIKIICKSNQSLRDDDLFFDVLFMDIYALSRMFRNQYEQKERNYFEPTSSCLHNSNEKNIIAYTGIDHIYNYINFFKQYKQYTNRLTDRAKFNRDAIICPGSYTKLDSILEEKQCLSVDYFEPFGLNPTIKPNYLNYDYETFYLKASDLKEEYVENEEINFSLEETDLFNVKIEVKNIFKKENNNFLFVPIKMAKSFLEQFKKKPKLTIFIVNFETKKMILFS